MPKRVEAAPLGIQSRLFRAGLSGLWYSGLPRWLERWTAGKGAVLMLHRVQPERAAVFSPNARLSITPAYLASLLCSLRATGIDVLSLDAALERVGGQGATRRFVCFTFDDGYRDNLEHALPVFQRFGAPFTVYATTSFAQRTLAPWWDVLEVVVAANSVVRWTSDRGSTVYAAADGVSKQRTFEALARRFLPLPIAELRRRLRRFACEHDVSLTQLADRDMCGWPELRAMRDAGVEIGCHTASHACLANETLAEVRRELCSARSQLQAELGGAVRHLAYPYGRREHVGPREFALARELGFASAVTTRKGALFASHAQARHAWPRVEVTPSFARSPHYLQAILSGLPLLACNRGRRVVTG